MSPYQVCSPCPSCSHILHVPLCPHLPVFHVLHVYQCPSVGPYQLCSCVPPFLMCQYPLYLMFFCPPFSHIPCVPLVLCPPSSCISSVPGVPDVPVFPVFLYPLCPSCPSCPKYAATCIPCPVPSAVGWPSSVRTAGGGRHTSGTQSPVGWRWLRGADDPPLPCPGAPPALGGREEGLFRRGGGVMPQDGLGTVPRITFTVPFPGINSRCRSGHYIPSPVSYSQG